MALTCPTCSRLNPADALYCYQDGSPLRAAAGRAAHLDPGSRPFPTPFVFPSGLTCTTFDQLALACANNWEAAVDLMRRGFLAGFLGGLGRADLALAAREAARYPDPDRGLNQLLAQLPARSLVPPRLAVETRQVNLGQLRPGDARRFELRLSNLGMGLLHGTVSCDDTPWLAVGEGAGAPSKVFQFLHESVIPVHVNGNRLRASKKPLAGRVAVRCNGGDVLVAVTAEVPVVPFADGVLAGARSPRQVAEKARDRPKEAAALFERGAVAAWYRANGWAYPVLGEVASGVAAVQQFFEALGLTTPPRVTISDRALSIFCKPGEALRHTLFVSTPEKRPVYARATVDRPWLKVSEVRLEGRSAAVVVSVPAVPAVPGETLEGRVTVTANGNQRFEVSITLNVAAPARPAPPPAPPPELVGMLEPASLPLPDEVPAAAPWANGGPTAGLPVARLVHEVPRDEPVLAAIPVGVPPGGRGSGAAFPVARPAPAPLDVPEAEPDEYPDEPWPRARGCLSVLPVLFLALGLLVAFVHDLVVWRAAPATATGEPELTGEDDDPGGAIALSLHDKTLEVVLSNKGLKSEQQGAESISGYWWPTMRFGLVMVEEGRSPVEKRLTYEKMGLSNNTCVRLDGNEHLFGEQPFRTEKGDEFPKGWRWHGRWRDKEERDLRVPGGEGRKSIWYYDREKVTVTQTVEVVPGVQSGRRDTCLVRYWIDNGDARPHNIGLRFLLDTFIGGNDGVPFLIPGRAELCSTSLEFRGEQVPDFIQALEKEDLTGPGTVAQVQLRVAGLEPPLRVTVGAYPDQRLGERCNQEKTLWEVPVHSIKRLPPGDSAVVLYWEERALGPGQSRTVGFSYGLGRVAGKQGGGRLALTTGGSFRSGEVFTATAYVGSPSPGEEVTLALPEGFELVEGKETQAVPPPARGSERRISPVTWRVRAPRAGGTYALRARLSTGAAQAVRVKITVKTIFGD